MCSRTIKYCLKLFSFLFLFSRTGSMLRLRRRLRSRARCSWWPGWGCPPSDQSPTPLTLKTKHSETERKRWEWLNISGKPLLSLIHPRNWETWKIGSKAFETYGNRIFLCQITRLVVIMPPWSFDSFDWWQCSIIKSTCQVLLHSLASTVLCQKFPKNLQIGTPLFWVLWSLLRMVLSKIRTT